MFESTRDARSDRYADRAFCAAACDRNSEGCTDEKAASMISSACRQRFRAQEAKTKKSSPSRKPPKENADAENAAASAALDSERLRKQRTRTVILPPRPPVPAVLPAAIDTSPSRQRAYRELVAGIRVEATDAQKP